MDIGARRRVYTDALMYLMYVATLADGLCCA
jgi:hypothetical protein